MQYHPDRNPGDKDGEERFKEVNEAYTVLSDPEKRAHFDRFGTVGPAAGGGGTDTGFGTLFEDIFENFFSGGARSSRRSRATRGEDLQYELKIALEEAAAGVETKIQIPRPEQCDACGGTGVEPGARLETSRFCRGRGEVRRTPGSLTVAHPCPRLQGAGPLNRPPSAGTATPATGSSSRSSRSSTRSSARRCSPSRPRRRRSADRWRSRSSSG